MMDFTPPAPAPLAQPPSFVSTVVQSLAQHGLTMIAGMLVANGVIQSGQQAQLVSLGLAVVVWATGQGWSLLNHYLHAKNNAVMVAQAKAGQ